MQTRQGLLAAVGAGTALAAAGLLILVAMSVVLAVHGWPQVSRAQGSPSVTLRERVGASRAAAAAPEPVALPQRPTAGATRTPPRRSAARRTVSHRTPAARRPASGRPTSTAAAPSPQASTPSSSAAPTIAPANHTAGDTVTSVTNTADTVTATGQQVGATVDKVTKTVDRVVGRITGAGP